MQGRVIQHPERDPMTLKHTRSRGRVFEFRETLNTGPPSFNREPLTPQPRSYSNTVSVPPNVSRVTRDSRSKLTDGTFI